MSERAAQTITEDSANSAGEERMETKDIAHIAARPFVVASASDGSMWAGTDAWLLRDPNLPRNPNAGALDKLVGRPYAVKLERVCHGRVPILASRGGTLCRGYLRPDGITVWLNDVLVRAIEEACEGEDIDGSLVEAEFAIRQADDRFSPIGFFEQPDDVLMSIVMPIKGINEHLGDGAGRSI